MISVQLVLDTNIVVSAALKPSSLPRTVLRLALEKPAHLYLSEPIFGEYRRVLSRPELHVRKGLRLQYLHLLRDRARFVTPHRRIAEAADPEDDKFLECADACRADYLITGNTGHFPRIWRSTRTVTAREFLEAVAPSLVASR